jgi:hypothetical protein
MIWSEYSTITVYFFSSILSCVVNIKCNLLYLVPLYFARVYQNKELCLVYIRKVGRYQRVIRGRKSKKGRQFNGQKKKDKRKTMMYLTLNRKLRSSNTKPTKNHGWTLVVWKGKQFLLHMWHPLCYSCYKTSNKSWMRKGQDSDYDTQNISVAIWDTDILVTVNQVMVTTIKLSNG